METASLLSRLASAKIVCIGDLMLDRFVEGDVQRISPEAPIPVLTVTSERKALGGVGNVARNIAALGGEAVLFATVGDDAAGKDIRALLDDLPGLTSRLHVTDGRPSAVKTRYVSGRQQLLRADREEIGDLDARDASALVSGIADTLNGAGALILSDYGKGVLSRKVIEAAIAAAHRVDIPVIVDPKGRDFTRYRGADIITPNRQELALASGYPVDGDDGTVAACRTVATDCDIRAVLATRSEEGMTLYQAPDTMNPNGVSVHLPTRAREVFDVVGAGDTVVAALACGLAAGLDAVDAAALANRAAGIVVGKVGTAVAYPAELLADAHVEQFQSGEAKTLPVAAAVDRVASWRRDGKRIGFTNGCFDLLHPGHISLIDQARGQCDRLVVGLNSDESVRRLKGDGRPVQNEAARATVLAALGKVDLVVIFAEDTPIELIRAIRPDVLVKGADYTKEEVVGAADVESWGGRVVLARLMDGQSTTGTLARINGDTNSG